MLLLTAFVVMVLYVGRQLLIPLALAAMLTFLLRFYAGAPLRSNNLPIGSLCILDIKPRHLSEREKRLLEAIAEDVMEEFTSRETVGPPGVLVA